MPVIREQLEYEGHFTQIPNAWLRDENLRIKAIRLLAQLLSPRENWSVTIRTLAKTNNCGRDMIRSAVEELEAAGYLTRKQERKPGGEFAEVTWTTTSPLPGLPASDKPASDNPAYKKTKSKKNNHKKDMPNFDLFWERYPRRVGKAEAARVWKRLDPETAREALDGAERISQDPNLPPKQYIPYPATWLNRAGWEDEPYPDRDVSRETKPAAEGPGRGDWIRQLHEAGEHFACNHD
jgi:hypothetical protein